ncbi:GNAT family N-acetyltransferase [Yunchengibacter salinarum]|uniref:GNAT family N-acetyltransferase n=1 Tax=Yunchengibacter salinarum TaxID=3133399 RepID=UPI0035B67FCC
MAIENNSADSITIRQANDGDIPFLVEFLVKLAVHVAGGTPQTLKQSERKNLTKFLTTALADEDKMVVVAEDLNARLVGMGYIHVWRRESIWEEMGDKVFKSGIIDNIWVEPEYRQSGVFRAMLRELVAFAEEQGVHELVLEYALSNKEAEEVWTRLGFRPTGVRATALAESVMAVLSDPE